MGNFVRKSMVAPAVAVEAEEVDAEYLDPRSPTPDVVRTPLNGKDGVKHKITKNVDLTKKIESYTPEEKVIHNNPILSAVIRKNLQSYDPRSPTQDFERTPIVVNVNTQETNNNQGIQHNGSVMFDEANSNAMDPEIECENAAKNLSEDFLDSTFENTFKDSEPLGSSTASQDAIEGETSSEPKVLLETNFDYVPTDESKEKSDIETPIQLVNKHISKFKIIEADPRSPTQGIDRTPIVVLQKEEAPSPDDKVEVISEETLIAALQNDIADLRRTPAVNGTGLLIYEDAAADLTPRKTQSATKGCRTPLSCMKNKTEERSKSTIVIDKKKVVSRIPKRISSVQQGAKNTPVELSRVAGGEMENTPPQSHRDVWDKDGSIVM